MLEKHPLLDSTIISCLKIHYGIEVDSLTFLSLGADPNASVYKVQTQGQKAYFIKLKRGHPHDIGVEIVELLENAGVQQIIPPIKTIHDKTTQHIDDFTLIVYPSCPSTNGYTMRVKSSIC